MNTKPLLAALAAIFLATSAQAATPMAPVNKRLQAVCMAADFNHDGMVSLDEFHQDVLSSWRALQPDATGYVVIADLNAVPGMGRGMIARLKRADVDGDGRLSFKEVATARMAYFDAADSNNDDSLALQECVDYQRNLTGASGKAKK